MTFIHTVIVKFSRQLSVAESGDLVRACLAMKSEISCIKQIKCGCDLGVNGPPRMSYSLTAEFDSIDDYKVYAGHLVHLEFIQRYLKPFLLDGGRTAIQYEI